MTLANKIVQKLNLPIIAKKAHGNSPEIKFIDLIDVILNTATLKEVAKVFGAGEQTINRTISKHLVPIFGNINGGNDTWKYRLLASIDYKECHCCKQIKPYTKFGKDKHRSDGKFLKCKYCRSFDNTALYARRKLRIPSWYDNEKHLIAEFYDNCPEGFHVDHIIPLQGRLVSGLHTLNNLQYLSSAENIAKGNKYCPDGEIW